MLNIEPLEIITANNTVINITINSTILINCQGGGHKATDGGGLGENGGVHRFGKHGGMVVDVVDVYDEMTGRCPANKHF